MRINKKLLSVLLVVMMVSLFSVTAAAQTIYSGITLANGEDFTLVLEEDEVTHAITVLGMDDFWMTHSFTEEEQQYIEWETEDPTIAKLWDGSAAVNSLAETDTAAIKAIGKGMTAIIVTYDHPSADPVSVPITVVVEDPNQSEDETKNIQVTIIGEDIGTISHNVDVEINIIKNTFGSSFDDNKVLQHNPSAMHALVQALVAEFGEIEVANNVIITSQGSFVEAIAGDENYMDENFDYIGWQFEVNEIDPGYAASVHQLEADDEITWEFKKFDY